MSSPGTGALHRTTVDLPADLLERAQNLVEHGAVRSRNSLIVTPIAKYLHHMERAAIDAQFAAMASDESRRLMVSIAEAFARSDWEALNEVEHATR